VAWGLQKGTENSSGRGEKVFSGEKGGGDLLLSVVRSLIPTANAKLDWIEKGVIREGAKILNTSKAKSHLSKKGL